MPHRARPARRLPAWCVAAFVAVACAVAWWASAIRLYHGPDHLVGPFRVPIALEWSLAGAAVASAAAAGVWLTLPSRSDRGSARGGLSPITSFWLVSAAALTAWCWRVLTSGVDGANIGGGLVIFAGPFFIASAVQAALLTERAARGGGLRHFRTLTTALWFLAWAVAAAFWFGLG